MKKSISACMAVCTMFLAGNLAAQEHLLTYDKNNKSVGQTVNIAGMPHTIVKLPFREFGSGDKYEVIFPAPTYGENTFGNIWVQHDSVLEEESNITIDGKPAHYSLVDGQSFDISSNGDGTQHFSVYGYVDLYVAIVVGSTTIYIQTYLEMIDPGTGFPPLTSTNIGPSYNAVPHANWSKYKDPNKSPNNLINGMDKFLDMIRIKAI